VLRTFRERSAGDSSPAAHGASGLRSRHLVQPAWLFPLPPPSRFPWSRPHGTARGGTDRNHGEFDRLLGFALLLSPAVLALELLDPSGGVHKLHLPGEERVTGRTDFDVDLGTGAAGCEGVPATAHHRRLPVIGMNVFLHVQPPRLPGESQKERKRPKVWPVRPNPWEWNLDTT